MQGTVAGYPGDDLRISGPRYSRDIISHKSNLLPIYTEFARLCVLCKSAPCFTGSKNSNSNLFINYLVGSVALFLALVAFDFSCCAARFFGPVTRSPAAISSCFALLSKKIGCGLYRAAGSVSRIRLALCRACMFSTKRDSFE